MNTQGKKYYLSFIMRPLLKLLYMYDQPTKEKIGIQGFKLSEFSLNFPHISLILKRHGWYIEGKEKL